MHIYAAAGIYVSDILHECAYELVCAARHVSISYIYQLVYHIKLHDLFLSLCNYAILKSEDNTRISLYI